MFVPCLWLCLCALCAEVSAISVELRLGRSAANVEECRSTWVAVVVVKNYLDRGVQGDVPANRQHCCLMCVVASPSRIARALPMWHRPLCASLSLTGLSVAPAVVAPLSHEGLVLQALQITPPPAGRRRMVWRECLCLPLPLHVVDRRRCGCSVSRGLWCSRCPHAWPASLHTPHSESGLMIVDGGMQVLGHATCASHVKRAVVLRRCCCGS